MEIETADRKRAQSSPAARISSITGMLSLPRKDFPVLNEHYRCLVERHDALHRQPRGLVEPCVAPPGRVQLTQFPDDQLYLIDNATGRVEMRIQVRSSSRSSDTPLSISTSPK